MTSLVVFATVQPKEWNWHGKVTIEHEDNRRATKNEESLDLRPVAFCQPSLPSKTSVVVRTVE